MTYTNTYAGADGVVLLAKDADDQFDLIEAEFAALPLNSAPGPIGSVTPSTGAFTTLSASGTVSGAGITARFSAPGPIGDGTPSTGAFTTLSASGAVSGAGFTSRFSAPGPIGDVTPSTGAFTTVNATGVATVGGITATGVMGFTPTGSVTWTYTGNSQRDATIANANAGASVAVGWGVSNGTKAALFGIDGTGSNWYGSGLGTGIGYIYTTNNTFAIIADGTGTIKFAAGGTTKVAEILSTGLEVTGTVKSTAGTGTGQPVMVGTLSVNTTAVGNVGAGTDDLMTYSLPANSLSANGNGVRIKAWGTLANNGNTKTVTLLFGSQTLITKALAGAYGEVYSWEIEAVVFRTGSNTQTNFTKLAYTGTVAGGTIPLTGVGNLTQADTGAIVIKCTGAATADNDIVQTGMIVEFIN